MLTQELVKELFDYHEDGYLIWKVKTAICNKIGDIAGSNSKGDYSRVRIFGKRHAVHRIIFLWHKGYLPEGIVDHRDRRIDNNKIDNLRDATLQCNQRNRKLNSNNSSGVTGVYPIKSGKSMKWAAVIAVNSKLTHLGCFNEFKDAVKARWVKEVELRWNGCNTTSSAFIYMKNNKMLKVFVGKRDVFLLHNFNSFLGDNNGFS